MVILHLTCQRQRPKKKKPTSGIAAEIANSPLRSLESHCKHFSRNYGSGRRQGNLRAAERWRSLLSSLSISPRLLTLQDEFMIRSRKEKFSPREPTSTTTTKHAWSGDKYFSAVRLTSSRRAFHFQIVGIFCRGKMCFWRPLVAKGKGSKNKRIVQHFIESQKRKVRRSQSSGEWGVNEIRRFN